MSVGRNREEKEENIYYEQPAKIHNKNLKKSLGWKTISNNIHPALEEPHSPLSEKDIKVRNIEKQGLESLWKFEKENLIRE